MITVLLLCSLRPLMILNWRRQAREMCGDVSACLFDVAATGRLDIGMSALSAEGGKENCSRIISS